MEIIHNIFPNISEETIKSTLEACNGNKNVTVATLSGDDDTGTSQYYDVYYNTNQYYIQTARAKCFS